MQTSSEINGIQAGILRQLFSKDGLRFAEINIGDVSSDQFSYHLRQLVKYGLIDKSPDNTYKLSTMGKTRTIMLYPNKDGFIEQGFMAVRIVLSKIENDQEYFLVRKRTAVPYKDTYATPGDKILFGEDIAQAAVRAMETHTGLKCDVKLCGITHIKDDYLGKIVQDKYFFVFVASNPQGELIEFSRTGRNEWLTYDEIEASGKSIQCGLEILKMATSKQLKFTEKTLKISSY
jgi:ADP-ribose pyrophosphatase YjhB (NUDIX family)